MGVGGGGERNDECGARNGSCVVTCRFRCGFGSHLVLAFQSFVDKPEVARKAIACASSGGDEANQLIAIDWFFCSRTVVKASGLGHHSSKLSDGTNGESHSLHIGSITQIERQRSIYIGVWGQDLM
jgi:hypothetical protein